MKSFVVLGGLLLIAVTGISSSPHPHHRGPPLSEEQKKFMEECREEAGVTEEEEREMHKKRDFKNEKMRCMAACMLKKEGLLLEGNELDVDKFVEKLKEKHPESTADLKAVVEECLEKAKKKEDECDFARTVVHCTHKKTRRGRKGPKGPPPHESREE